MSITVQFILGLTGPQRAGKTTVCSILEQEYGWLTISIGQAIKDQLHDLVGMEFEESEKDYPSPYLRGQTPRDAYVYLGNLDEFRPDIWVRDMIYKQYEPAMSLAIRPAVIESVGKQFQWKAVADYCHQNFIPCAIADVSRPGCIYKDNRTSVWDVRPTFTIDNSGDMNQLRDEIERVLNLITVSHESYLRGSPLPERMGD